MIPLVCPLCASELKVIQRTVGTRNVRRGECPTQSTSQLVLIGTDVLANVGKPGSEFVTGWEQAR